jgi:hypothetical protein
MPFADKLFPAALAWVIGKTCSFSKLVSRLVHELEVDLVILRGLGGHDSLKIIQHCFADPFKSRPEHFIFTYEKRGFVVPHPRV